MVCIDCGIQISKRATRCSLHAAHKFTGNPEWREKQLEGIRKRFADLEWRKKRAEGVRKYYKELRRKEAEMWRRKDAESMGEMIRELWKDPEFRRKYAETWRINGRIGGRIGGPIGGRIVAERHARLKPNLGEATVAALLMQFYPDVWADTVWQRGLPSRFRGVPDIRHPLGVVGEYDGGAHHLFEDHSAKDATKDAERRAAGFAVVRETDPFILATKFAFAVRNRPNF